MTTRNRSFEAASFPVVVALDESRKIGRQLTDKEMHSRQYQLKLSQKDLQQYRRLAQSELGFDPPAAPLPEAPVAFDVVQDDD